MNVDKLSKKNALNAVSLGKDSQYIDFDSFEKPIHRQMLNEIAALKQKAAVAGFDLILASGYRSFDQQLVIWNEKAQGKRPLLDADEKPIEINFLNKTELLFAILRWTALPGSSRHHWGCDVDIYDASAIDENHKLQLTVKETVRGGPFEYFYIWLNTQINDGSKFFRPYEKDLGGVAPEPWHLSHRALAEPFETNTSLALLESNIKSSDIELKDEILKNIDEIYERFVRNINS